MDTIKVFLDVSSDFGSTDGDLPVFTNITVCNEYDAEATWSRILGGLAKGLEAFYGYSFSKEDLHKFADKYGK